MRRVLGYVLPVIVSGALCGAVMGADTAWSLPDEMLLIDPQVDQTPAAPVTTVLVPAPDGALAGVTVLTGLAVAYLVRHHRARRAR